MLVFFRLSCESTKEQQKENLVDGEIKFTKDCLKVLLKTNVDEKFFFMR